MKLATGENVNNRWDWEWNGNKTWLNLGAGMGMNSREREGLGLKNTLPLISSANTENTTTSPVMLRHRSIMTIHQCICGYNASAFFDHIWSGKDLDPDLAPFHVKI